MSTTTASIRPLTRDLLAWIARQPRSYAEAMDAWRSSCPRFTIWEDAIADGLICEVSGAGGKLREVQVVLTARGLAALEGA
jgi:hypothetical protein